MPGEAHQGTRVRCGPVLDATFRPAGPYRLNLMTYGRPFQAALPGGGLGAAWQGGDGLVRLRAPDEEGLELLRFMLALDADTTEFARRFRHDPLLGPSIRNLHGLRPLRRATVAHALLRAVCGQLIEAGRALEIERAIVRACGEPAPSRHAIGALSPAELRRLGLATHRASTLVRVCRTLDLEALRTQPLEAVEARLLRERGLGPWSLGVIALEGLGSYRHGLVGDLGLVKLCSALRGRWVELPETAELLAPYEEWAGLAGVYLTRGWSAGLVPGASSDRARLVRCRAA
jgi:3-methyladenine DNA glycosylase/8-oxoguanine DNA glycosylase